MSDSLTSGQAIGVILDNAGVSYDQMVQTDAGERTAFQVLEAAVLGALDEIEENEL